MKIHPDDDMFTGSREHYESVGKQLATHVGTAAAYLTWPTPGFSSSIGGWDSHQDVYLLQKQ